MRLNYSDEEDYPGQFNIWQANCHRSLRGKKGQVALKRLRAALLSMPTKRLIREAISAVNAAEGRLEVCALGAVAMMEDLDDILYSDDDPTDAGEKMGFPHLVAWKVVEQNDIQLDTKLVHLEGPDQVSVHGYVIKKPGNRTIDLTPEERYAAMLKWVESEIVEAPRVEPGE